MVDRRVTVPAVDKLERLELLTLVEIISAGRIWDLDIARARWQAASDRYNRRSAALRDAICDYAEASARRDTARAEGRATRSADRALTEATAAYRRAEAAADVAYAAVRRRFADLQEIRAEGGDR